MVVDGFLKLAGLIALGVLSHGIWLRFLAPNEANDGWVDQSYRVQNAARMKGAPNLPVPVQPGWATSAVMSTFAAFLLSWSFAARRADAESIIRSGLLLALPLVAGAVQATRTLRKAFVARWRKRRADPDDVLRREFGSVPID